ncbi:hypothetical protein CY34DRAFT_18855 [Suillus luteus UH-Slu-Lm8-n1]|uniref:Uncharacterized protein n=1 Tax=Suillus luteus UH-Slu-Lm8-n1 TaxID=930992 RepID=A0A0C9ZTQ5_9AGAM|nr:hypothetical protein CY34DRAFT_18855 [Suillus luteus UH-Slu-Lm8-n1]
MTLSREEGEHKHPFWYAHVLRAFHIQVLHTGPQARNRSPQTLEVLWVGFVPTTDDDAFGFLDPSFVIRGCHLIPAFAEGRSDALLRRGPSLARFEEEVDDWVYFYVNIFADRDMFAHFVGFGVGHEVQYDSSAIKHHSHEYLEGSESEDDDSNSESTTGSDIMMDSDSEGDLDAERTPRGNDLDEDIIEELENVECECIDGESDFDLDSEPDLEFDEDVDDLEDLYRF